MGYRNGRDVLPPDLLKLVQQYAEGECIYIPRDGTQKTFCPTEAAREREIRNAEIVRRHAGGCSVRLLAEEYWLSPQSIYKILSQSRK